MKVSIVICTRNRCDQLHETLQSLIEHRAGVPWEAVIVDNASDDATKSVIEAAGRRIDNLTYVFEAQRGLGAARDTAWRHARGEIVAFTDDDCILTPNYVDRLVEVFEDGRVAYIGGRIELFDPEDAPVTIDLREEIVPLPVHAFVPAGSLQGANMAVRRAVLEAIGGFDRRLGAGTPFPCEDIDVAAAAAWAGFAGRYDPRPVILHHHRRKAADEFKLYEGYDFGRGAYYMKYVLRKDTRAAYLRGWWAETGRLNYYYSWLRLMRELGSARRFWSANVAQPRRSIGNAVFRVAEIFAMVMKVVLRRFIRLRTRAG